MIDTDIKLIKIKEEILSESTMLGEQIRANMKASKTYFINLMASPGAGKTSLLINTIKFLKNNYNIGIIEGDIESMVDSTKIRDQGVTTVQIQTGGACHLDSPMIQKALDTIDTNSFDLLFVENIGNLVCPAEFDIGETKKVMILSVPEGHDKVLKYPLMFSVSDILIVNKIDYIEGSDFNLDFLKETVYQLNPKIKIFEISCKTGKGLTEWYNWLRNEIETIKELA